MFFKISVSIFFGEIPRSGIAGSYDGSMRHLHSVFPWWLQQSYLPTNTAQGFPLLHSLNTCLCHCYVFLDLFENKLYIWTYEVP